MLCDILVIKLAGMTAVSLNDSWCNVYGFLSDNILICMRIIILYHKSIIVPALVYRQNLHKTLVKDYLLLSLVSCRSVSVLLDDQIKEFDEPSSPTALSVSEVRGVGLWCGYAAKERLQELF